MFSRMHEPRGASVVGLLMGLLLLAVGAWAIGLPIFEAVNVRIRQRKADDFARLPVIASGAQFDDARDGDKVLLEGRISPSNMFTALRTWTRRDSRYVMYDGKFAAYWTQQVRPDEGGVIYDSRVIRSVPAGLRVQLAPGTEVTIENADFKTGWERGFSGGIYGRDLPPVGEWVFGLELDELVTVQGRLHHRSGARTIEAEELFDTTAADNLRYLNQIASEARAAARGFSGVLWALAFVVGGPSLIGGIFVLRRSCKNPSVRRED